MFKDLSEYIRNVYTAPKAEVPTDPLDLAIALESTHANLRSSSYSVRKRGAVEMAALLCRVLARRPDLADALAAECKDITLWKEHWPIPAAVHQK